MQKKIFQTIGVLGTFLCVLLFVKAPSWPTPDKLLFFVIFIFMIFSQGWEAIKRFVPFVGVLLVYESFRGLVPSLNKHVHYIEMVKADRWLFGGTLPTTTLQNWFWSGHAQWQDFMFYLAYMMHFLLPIGLAILVWKKREKQYWKYITTYLTVSFMGFLTFLAYPAAPPWLAAQKGIIEPIGRVSSSVWWALGIHDFPSVYHKISPNPVAAIPSLHAAYATLFSLFIFKFFGKKWGLVSLIYPFLIFVGTVYMGEHYAIDEIIGAAYGFASFFGVAWIWKWRAERKSKTPHKPKLA